MSFATSLMMFDSVHPSIRFFIVKFDTIGVKVLWHKGMGFQPPSADDAHSWTTNSDLQCFTFIAIYFLNLGSRSNSEFIFVLTSRKCSWNIHYWHTNGNEFISLTNFFSETSQSWFPSFPLDWVASYLLSWDRCLFFQMKHWVWSF